MTVITFVLSILGLSLMLYALIARKWSESVVSILFGSLLIGLAVADRTEPKIGLAIVLIYSGGLTALTYVSTILLSKKELAFPLPSRILYIIVFPILASILFLIVFEKMTISAVPACPIYQISFATTEDIVALSAAFVIAIGVILILLGGAKR